MNKSTAPIVLKVLSKLLSPIVRLCLKSGISAQDFYKISKKVFILEASKNSTSEVRMNVSKVCALTGINRRELSKLIAEIDKAPTQEYFPLLTRVVGLWLTDSKYIDSNGKPKALSFGTSDSEFHKLVSEVSKDISPGTVCEQLLEDKTLIVSDNKLCLQHAAYVPKANLEEAFQMMSSDVNDLIMSVIDNIKSETPTNHHLTTEFDSIPIQDSKKISEWLRQAGQDFHNKIRNYLKDNDDDLIRDPSQKCRVVFGSFARVESNNEDL